MLKILAIEKFEIFKFLIFGFLKFLNLEIWTV